MIRERLFLMAKSVMIALIASVVSWLYLLAFSVWVGGELASPGYQGVMFYGSLVGCFVVGLPVALLVFWMSHKHILASPETLAMIVVLAGIMMVLASYVIGERQGVILLGVPAIFASATFGILGWFWIIRPLRGNSHG